jgi:hypothetical protein
VLESYLRKKHSKKIASRLALAMQAKPNAGGREKTIVEGGNWYIRSKDYYGAIPVFLKWEITAPTSFWR